MALLLKSRQREPRKNCAVMQSRTSTPSRINDVVSPLSETLSPENFHVSLSSLMLGHEPVVPQRWSPVATNPITPLYSERGVNGNEFAAGVKQSSASQECSVSGVEQTSSSEGDASVRACDKNSERYREHDYERSEGATDTDEPISTSEAEFTCDNSSSDAQPQLRKVRQRKFRPATSSKPTLSDKDSQETSPEASTSAGTVEGSSSRAADTTEDDTGWTLSEDAILRGMKEDDRHPTWAEISSVIRRLKKECQLRWKVLKNQPIVADAEAGSGLGDVDNMTGDLMSKDKYKDRKTKKHKSKLSVQDQKDKPSGRKHKQTERGGKEQETYASRQLPSIRSGDVPCSPSSSESGNSDPNGTTFTGTSQGRREKRYMYKHIDRILYPSTISPEPDEYFTQRDCDVLAAIDSKYKQGKYLEMQANFCNATGRMIPLGIIRDKCERAEEVERRRVERGREAIGRKRIEKWVKNIDEKDLRDPDT